MLLKKKKRHIFLLGSVIALVLSLLLGFVLSLFSFLVGNVFALSLGFCMTGVNQMTYFLLFFVPISITVFIFLEGVVLFGSFVRSFI